jgi:hypothetical protein
MNRRLVALLVVLAISLQGPSLAYAAAAKMMPASCAGHVLDHSGNNDSCCPQGVLPGLCCAGGLVLTGLPSTQMTLPLVSSSRMPPVSGSVAFATERATPLFRPPIA